MTEASGHEIRFSDQPFKTTVRVGEYDWDITVTWQGRDVNFNQGGHEAIKRIVEQYVQQLEEDVTSFSVSLDPRDPDSVPIVHIDNREIERHDALFALFGSRFATNVVWVVRHDLPGLIGDDSEDDGDLDLSAFGGHGLGWSSGEELPLSGEGGWSEHDPSAVPPADSFGQLDISMFVPEDDDFF